MIKKYIPEKYNLLSVDIIAIIENVCGKIPITLIDRIIEFEASPEELQQIKADFLQAVEEVGEF
jgi:hypothetical protein